MNAAIHHIEYYLPTGTLTSEALTVEFPDWSVAKIEEKVGIKTRHVAADSECSSDLAVAAARKVFDSGAAKPSDIDFLLLCTQSPDYFLPTTACLVQDRLGLSKQCGALDFNLGCSGYVYGLGLAKGLIETGQASNVLLVTAETYTKFIHKSDRGVRTIFGDAAAATLLGVGIDDTARLGPFVYGTDGSGADNLIVRAGGMRLRQAPPESILDASLHMDGPEIFAFTMSQIPGCVRTLLTRTGMAIGDYDLFVFHQANRHMLEHLRKGLRIPEDKFYIAMEHCGNTVSATIPIALKHAQMEGRLWVGARVMLVGFGVGYSWGAVSIIWSGSLDKAVEVSQSMQISTQSSGPVMGAAPTREQVGIIDGGSLQ